MKNAPIFTIGLAILLTASAWAQSSKRTPYYVIDRTGNYVYGTAITSDPSGKVSIKLAGGAVRSFTAGQFRSAHAPAPKELQEATGFMRQGNWDAALGKLDAAWRGGKNLGSAGSIARLRSTCFLKKGQAAQADKALSEGLRFEKNADGKTKLNAARAEVQIANGDLAGAEQTLTRIRGGLGDPETATFVFNTRGMLLSKKGQKREAVLQYLKTVLLYPKAGHVRREALVQVVAIMKELKDNRASQFASVLKSDYGN
ncbi:MAG: tetratricopeptide (TPR) repeat protein [Rhodothermales bacterium]|jgi:tetratricopeptide (TPR) repeat protein